MDIKPAYKSFDSWLKNLSTIQYALFVWSATFTFSLLVGITFVGNSLMNATMSAAGGAIGVTIVLTIMEKRNG
jgi:heme exporter protein D